MSTFPSESSTPLLQGGAHEKNFRFKIAICSYICMLTAWVFDFRSEGAGQGLALQAVFMAIYMLAFLIFIFSALYYRIYNTFLLIIFSLNFISIGVISGIYIGQDVYGVLRNSFNVFIYISSAFSSYVIFWMLRFYLVFIRKMISYFCIAYLLSAFLIVYFFHGGVDSSTIRYEIIGASVVMSLTYLSLFFRFKLQLFEILAALIVVSVVAISVTRTWIVVVAVQAAIIIILGGGFSKASLRRVALPGAFVLFSLVVLQSSGVPIIERWTERLFASDRVGVDPTALTRQRQIDSMIDSIKDRPLFGNGFYGESSYWLEKDLGGFEGLEFGNGFGHNQDVSVIFIAGVIGGAPLLIWQYWIGLNSVLLIYRSRKVGERDDIAMLGMLCSLCVIGTLIYGQFGGTFESRGMTLWYGVSTGLMLGLRSMPRHRQAL